MKMPRIRLRSRFNSFGCLGVLALFVLSIPQIRSALFGEKAKILDIFSGEVTDTGVVMNTLGQLTLLIPFYSQKYVFSYFDVGEVNVLTLALMVPVVYQYFCSARGVKSFCLLGFFFLPAPLLFLSTFNKEIFLVLCLYFAYARAAPVTFKKQALFFFYAASMRPYLAWIPFVMGVAKVRQLYWRVLAILGVAMVTPTGRDILYTLFNRRLAEKGYDANSEITQSTYVASLPDVASVIAEVVPQVFFPFFVAPSVKSLFFQCYIWGVVWVALKARNRFGGVLLVATWVYTMLDPDLGAFLRHISTFFVLVPLALKYDNRACVVLQAPRRSRPFILRAG
ncbi:MAG: hypothetical protein PW845_21485 [Pseudomonas sp.]|nr:hypothetical protein [Pseudomonas sp.]